MSATTGRPFSYGGGSRCEVCVCFKPAEAEMRGEGTRSVQLCWKHAKMAQQIVDVDRSAHQAIIQEHDACVKKAESAEKALKREHEGYLEQLKKQLEQGIPELLEASDLNPADEAIQKNLKVSREFLDQIAKALAD